MGHDTVQWEGFGWIPPQQADEEATLERTGQSMGLSPAGGRDGRDRIAGGGDLNLPPPEHSCTVYCDQAHYGPVSGGRAEAGVKGRQVVVGEGRTGFGGDMGGG